MCKGQSKPCGLLISMSLKILYSHRQYTIEAFHTKSEETDNMRSDHHLVSV